MLLPPSASISGWMPTGNDPPAPGLHELGAIHAKRGDCGSASWRLADNQVPFVVLARMVEPNLPARIEKTHDLACARVGGRDPIALVIVAHRAREPKIVSCGRPAERLRDKVIDLQRCSRDFGRG